MTTFNARLRVSFVLIGLSFIAACHDERPKLVASGDDGSGHAAPTAFTRAANAAVLEALPLDDEGDFEQARRGLIAQLEDPVIRNAEGEAILDLGDYEFEQGDAPDSVNPSLWRQAKLNAIHGLFEVVPGIYQVRGYDLANMTLVAGDTGWIVIDPLMTTETARTAMALVAKHLGERPISALIYTHSHVDHFGGVRGVLDEDDIARGVPVIAPEGFVLESLSENVLAGATMSRRAGYMFGFDLQRGARGHVDSGLGKASPRGTYGMVQPNRIVTGAPEEMVLDGVQVIFQNTPDAEAPAEMMAYFPKYHALCGAENVSHVLHNLYTLRGAKVRDAVSWAGHIDETLRLFGDEVEVLFASHHWPTWGKAAIVDHLKKQRDVYRYIHDQTLRLANQGETMLEIAEQLELPESLATTFANRGYYGTVSHNAKAVYQHYFGWFDANPANLHPLPPEQAAVRYVDAMGGRDAVLDKARAAYEQGDYRWTATLLNHLVFAAPEDEPARSLLADTYDQLGYQAESGPWRDFYLTGARELREGPPGGSGALPINAELVTQMDTGLFFQALSVRLDGAKAADRDTVLEFVFTDIGETHALEIENAVLHHSRGKASREPDATIRTTRAVWDQIVTKDLTIPNAILQGDLDVDGSRVELIRFFSLLEEPGSNFDIVTP